MIEEGSLGSTVNEQVRIEVSFANLVESNAICHQELLSDSAQEGGREVDLEKASILNDKGHFAEAAVEELGRLDFGNDGVFSLKFVNFLTEFFDSGSGQVMGFSLGDVKIFLRRYVEDVLL